MAVVSGTYLTYDSKGNREDLADVIFNISPEETPLSSSVSKGSAEAVYHEWQTDSLAAAAANAQLEGDDAAFSTPAATTRVGNYCQISRKTLILSETQEKINKAGRKSERAYQLAKLGAELKRDIEKAVLETTAANAGAAGTARTSAGLGTWIKTNDSLGATGASSTHTTGAPTVARTDGTQRALTETLFKAVLQSVWTQGGTPKVAMVGPFNKTVISGFSGIATRNFDMSNVKPGPTAIIAAADVYVSDWGVVRVMPNRFQRERDAFILDMDLIEMRFLRPMKTEKLAKTGDAEKEMLITEWTLRVNQEAGLGMVADLNAS